MATPTLIATANPRHQPRAETSEKSGQCLLTVKELAQLLNMSERWIHERTRRREIPCYRFGSALRFDVNEIWGWLARWHEASITA